MMVKPREYKTLFYLEFILNKVTYYETQKTTNDETTVTVTHLDGQTLSIKETPNKTKRDYGENMTNVIFKYGKSGLFSAISSQLDNPCEADLMVLRQTTLGDKITEGYCKVTLGGIYSDLSKFSPNRYVKSVEDTRVFNDKHGNTRGCISFILKLSFYGKVKTAESEYDCKILRFESNTEEEIILQMIPADSEANWAMYNYTPRKKDMPNFDRYADTLNLDVLSSASKQILNEDPKNPFSQTTAKLPEYVENAFKEAIKKRIGNMKPPENKAKPSIKSENPEPSKSVVLYKPDLIYKNLNQFFQKFPDHYFENLAKANTERLVHTLKEQTKFEEQQMWKHQNEQLLYQNQILPHMFANNPVNYAIHTNQGIPPMYKYGVPLQNRQLNTNPYLNHYYPMMSPPYGFINKGLNMNVPHYPPGTPEKDIKNLSYKTNDKPSIYPGKPIAGYSQVRPSQQLYSAVPTRPELVQNYPAKVYGQGNALGNNVGLFYPNAQARPANYAPVKTYGSPTVTITAVPKELNSPPYNKVTQNNLDYNKGRHHSLSPPFVDGNAQQRRSQQTSHRYWNNGQDQTTGGHMTNMSNQVKQDNTYPSPHSPYDPSLGKNKRNSNNETNN